MAPSHDDHQETQPGHQETQPGNEETQTPATPASCYPPGYRFVPTDCELIRDYLQKKVNNEPIPISDIKETYLRLKNPMDLAAAFPKIGEHEWYFFTPRDRKYPNGERPDRAADSGYWKATGNDKPVVFEGSVIGFKRSLVFYLGKPMQGERTDWIMHEYTLNKTPRHKTKPRDMRLDDWVLCRIRKKPKPQKVRAKKRKARTGEESGGGVGVGVGATNNLDHEQHPIHHATNNLDHEQHPIHQHVNNNTTTEQYYCYDDQQHHEQPIHDHVNITATGQYYSYQQHEQPIHHHVSNNNNTGFGSGSGYGDWYHNNDGLDLEPSHVNPDDEVNGILSNAYLDEQTAAVTGFQEPIGTSSITWNDEAWNNEAFLPSYNTNINSNSMASWNNESAAAFLPPYNTNTNSNASWNNESAAAFFPAYDPCPAPANINNSANFGDNLHHNGGGKKKPIY